MSGSCHRIRVLIVVGLLAACGDDGARHVAEASEPANEEDASVDAPQDDAAQGSEDEDAATGEDGDAGDELDRGPPRDAGNDADDAGASDAEVTPGHDLGADCHDIDFDGPQNLVVSRMVAEHWVAPAGGAVVPGTYDLVSEQHFVVASASEQEADACDDYFGAYRERLVLTDTRWSRLNRQENHTVARQTFDYSVADGKIEQVQTCPAPGPDQAAAQPRSYSASNGELLVFDGLYRDDGVSYCDILYSYVRKP